jgi:hypothetical protein
MQAGSNNPRDEPWWNWVGKKAGHLSSASVCQFDDTKSILRAISFPLFIAARPALVLTGRLFYNRRRN